jgi:hypothetical protein
MSSEQAAFKSTKVNTFTVGQTVTKSDAPTSRLGSGRYKVTRAIKIASTGQTAYIFEPLDGQTIRAAYNGTHPHNVHFITKA